MKELKRFVETGSASDLKKMFKALGEYHLPMSTGDAGDFCTTCPFNESVHHMDGLPKFDTHCNISKIMQTRVNSDEPFDDYPVACYGKERDVFWEVRKPKDTHDRISEMTDKRINKLFNLPMVQEDMKAIVEAIENIKEKK
jgi:hypothetical protein